MSAWTVMRVEHIAACARRRSFALAISSVWRRVSNASAVSPRRVRTSTSPPSAQQRAVTTAITKRLRRPCQRAREALGVATAPELSRRVAVIHERPLVVAADAMEQPAQEDHPRKTTLGAGRESIEPALKRRDLAGLKRAL